MVEWQTRYFEGVVGVFSCGFKSHPPHQTARFNRAFFMLTVFTLPQRAMCVCRERLFVCMFFRFRRFVEELFEKIILIPNLLIDKVYKEICLKGGKSKPLVLTELVLNGFPAALLHPPQRVGLNL